MTLATTPDFTPAAVARRLAAEHADRIRFTPFAAAAGLRTLDAAYAVQDALVALRRPQEGPPRGYKVGLTSRSMQEMCGLGHPIAGVVPAGRLLADGAALAAADYTHLGVEFEIAIKLARDLAPDAGPLTVGAVAEAVAAVAPAVEIIDDRGADYSTLDTLSLVADNSWAEGAILGAFRPSWPPLDEAEARVEVHGETVGRGTGRDVLGHPFASVAWLAEHLAARGAGLRAGQIVLTGSIIRTQFPAPGAAYRYTVAGVGSIGFSVI